VEITHDPHILLDHGMFFRGDREGLAHGIDASIVPPIDTEPSFQISINSDRYASEAAADLRIGANFPAGVFDRRSRDTRCSS
jgi:hypothetical protein